MPGQTEASATITATTAMQSKLNEIRASVKAVQSAPSDPDTHASKLEKFGWALLELVEMLAVPVGEALAKKI